MTNVLQAFALLGLFLLIGTLLRAKIGWLQKLFIPASVVGGAVGLLVGPQIWGDLTPVQYPTDWIKMYSLLPGVLIVPVVASVPLGIQLSQKDSSSGTARNVFNMFFLMLALFAFQLAVGGAVGAFFATSMPDLGIYSTFGLEMPLGFSGGYGTAGVIGNMLNGMGLEYWEIAQGVAVTYATIGLLGGIISGIAIIKWLNGRNALEGSADAASLPKSWLTGLEPDPEKQRVAGRETTVSTSIDVIGFNLALILAGSGLAILLRAWVRSYDLPLIKAVPVWAYEIIVMGDLAGDEPSKNRVAGGCWRQRQDCIDSDRFRNRCRACVHAGSGGSDLCRAHPDCSRCGVHRHHCAVSRSGPQTVFVCPV